MDPPRTLHRIRIGKANIRARVVGEVEIVGTEPIGHPVRHLDQRWAVDIGPIIAGQHVWRDNGSVSLCNESGLLAELTCFLLAFVQVWSPPVGRVARSIQFMSEPCMGHAAGRCGMS